MRAEILLATAVALAWIGAGCSTRVVEARYDENEDFSLHRTWSWLSRTTESIDAPGADARSLDAFFTHSIDDDLAKRGLERTRQADADLLVAYRFSLRQRGEVVTVPAAPYLLSSHHASASFWVEGGRQEIRVSRDVDLWIGMLDPDGRVVWQGAFRERVPQGTALRLREVVARVLERFPVRDPAVVGSPAPTDGQAASDAPAAGSDR
jgi:hypothetical protein